MEFFKIYLLVEMTRVTCSVSTGQFTVLNAAHLLPDVLGIMYVTTLCILRFLDGKAGTRVTAFQHVQLDKLNMAHPMLVLHFSILSIVSQDAQWPGRGSPVAREIDELCVPGHGRVHSERLPG